MIPFEYAQYTKWWQRIPLWFKQPVVTGVDHASGNDYSVRFYYKILHGKVLVVKFERLV